MAIKKERVDCNGIKDREAFDGRLEFDVTLIPYTGSDVWVEEAIVNAHRCLCSDDVPDADEDCDYCNYRAAVESVS